MPLAGMPPTPQTIPPFTTPGTFFQWSGGTMELNRSNHGTARNRESGGFVNRSVMFTEMW